MPGVPATDAAPDIIRPTEFTIPRAQNEHGDDPTFYPLIWVEGIIGAGKSTFCAEVGKRLGVRVFHEPVDVNPYLEDFYRDEAGKRATAYPMQIWLMLERCIMQGLASDEATGVGGYRGSMLDRSISGDRVFAKMLWKDGYISTRDWRTYNRMHQMEARRLTPPTLLVYLDTDPETAYERVQARNRACEKGGAGVDLPYLRALHAGYRELLEECERGLLPWGHAVRVLPVPWDVTTVTPEQWDRTTRTVLGACRLVYA